MPKPSRPARRTYRTWILDSSRWEHYRPRPDDVVIATYPKAGTTWMQRIVGLLVFQSPEPQPIMQISAWIDRRFPEPIEAVAARVEAQTHRRFLKTHLPPDGLPIHDEVRYIHVARDGRDVCMSYHNHIRAFTPEALAALDRAGLEDAAIARPYPRVPADPTLFFRDWITQGSVPGQEDGWPGLSYFEFERGYWDERRRPNLLLVHYNDLKADLAGEMCRIADFLGIAVEPKAWPALVAAATFEAMRRDGDALMAETKRMFEGGASRFFHKGSNERWRGVLSAEDLALYEDKVTAKFPPACAAWVAQGRLVAGDPRLAA